MYTVNFILFTQQRRRLLHQTITLTGTDMPTLKKPMESMPCEKFHKLKEYDDKHRGNFERVWIGYVNL